MFDFFQKKNHALAPLQNVDFFLDFSRTSLFRSKKAFFPIQNKKKEVFFLAFSLQKNL